MSNASHRTALEETQAMPLYALIARDPEPERRQRARPAHLEHMERLDAAGRVRHGGPLLDDDSNALGSLIIIEAESLGDARATFAQDPYLVEDVFGRYEILETKQIYPRQTST